nr:rRNA-processing protein CGR1 [Ipomoea batatas]
MACTIDFRCLDEGFGGKTYKRKRAENEAPNDVSEEDVAAMEVEKENGPPPSKRQAVPSSEDPNKPVLGKPTYDGVIAGKVSGRKWKQGEDAGAEGEGEGDKEGVQGENKRTERGDKAEQDREAAKEGGEGEEKEGQHSQVWHQVPEDHQP